MQKNLSIQYLDPGLLSPNPWNPNKVGPDNERKLEKSLEELGEFKAIIAREREDGSLEILGGQHRWEIYRKRGEDCPVINLGKISEAQAKKITLADNARYGEDDTLILHDLLLTLGSPDDISLILPYSETDLTAIMGASEVDLSSLGLSLPTDIDDKDDDMTSLPGTEKVGATSKPVKIKVDVDSLEFVNDTLDEIIREQGYDDPDVAKRRGEALVDLCNLWRSHAHAKSLPTEGFDELESLELNP